MAKRAADAETTRYKSQYEALEASTAQELADLRALVARLRKDLAAARDDNAKLQVCLLALLPPSPCDRSGVSVVVRRRVSVPVHPESRAATLTTVTTTGVLERG